MEKIDIPALSFNYFEIKVYHIFYDNDNNFVCIVAPDSFVAISFFSFLYPDRDILNVVCCGPCFSLVP